MTEHLSSNVVNYLVWRYLQEAGYAKAALALAHDWNDEPDTLPFADKVQTHTLLRMLQDGLWLDDMRAAASNKMTKGKLYHLSEGGLQTRLVTAVLGSVFALRYNASANLLLSVCSTDVNSRICLWKEIKQEALYSAQTDHPVFAAEWMSDSTFVVAGYGILEVYEITPENKLIVQKSFSTITNWENLRYDPVCGIIACSSSSDEAHPQLGLILPGDTEIRTHACTPGEDITGLEFQPIVNPASHDAESPRLLATSSDSGFWTVQFWNAKKPFENVQRFSSGSVIEIAFSPDGYLLAAAGMDTVTFWDPEAGISKAKWKPSDSDEQKWDITLPDARDTELDHLLRWDADGKKLAYKLGNQVAIINFWSMNSTTQKV
ncbi:putative wd repeat protein [Neofusicoccum parvum UCRNP2]|uniref:Putative wd repeat protein n=1 Tax=Botryosphaeria parva (strain UCR-NP2) TaxID=1287680 RepID=R1EDU1_BOTPV|nr:putative wd repeat protein [Neofusicoccum parvum UCRNP2]